jgi:hypothetical protein
MAAEKGLQLVEGKGDDADTLFKKKVWVLDSNKFPFRQAEIYHQFHGKSWTSSFITMYSSGSEMPI